MNRIIQKTIYVIEYNVYVIEFNECSLKRKIITIKHAKLIKSAQSLSLYYFLLKMKI